MRAVRKLTFDCSLQGRGECSIETVAEGQSRSSCGSSKVPRMIVGFLYLVKMTAVGKNSLNVKRFLLYRFKG